MIGRTPARKHYKQTKQSSKRTKTKARNQGNKSLEKEKKASQVQRIGSYKVKEESEEEKK